MRCGCREKLGYNRKVLVALGATEGGGTVTTYFDGEVLVNLGVLDSGDGEEGDQVLQGMVSTYSSSSGKMIWRSE